MARELGIPPKTLYGWVAAYKGDPVGNPLWVVGI
ncbi:MAG: hypothetical protein OWR62_15850 [Sulfobacillus thermotolerans]|nr:hypothetical protein [Sulfobacillus thermotolerans]